MKDRLASVVAVIETYYLYALELLYLSSYVDFDGCVQNDDQYICKHLPELSSNENQPNPCSLTARIFMNIAPCGNSKG